MRRDVDAGRLGTFLKELGETAKGEVTVYLTGGATAILHGWRRSTVDVDLKMEPERDEVFRALPALKEKVERGHARDLADVRAMLERGLVEPKRLRELFAAIEPMLYRFPAVDPPTFRAALETALAYVPGRGQVPPRS